MSKLTVSAAVLVVLAVVFLGVPGLVGSITETRVLERVAAIDASPSASARLTSFDGGWFHSTAKIELSYLPDYMPALPFDGAQGGLASGTLPIRVDFAHGPIAVLNGTSFAWSKIVARLDTEAPGVADLERTLGVPYLFEFRGRTRYLGGLVFDADAPAFELPLDDVRVTFSGATLDGTFAEPRIVANAHIASAAFTSPTGTFTLDNLRAGTDNEIVSQYVMPGETTFSIERIAATEGGTVPVLELANLRFVSTTGLDATGALIDVRADYDLDSIRVEESVVTAAKFGMAMRNLDVAALQAYSTAVQDVARTGDPSALMTSLGPDLDRALRAGPSFTIDPLSFQLDAEPFEGRIVVSTNTANLPPAGALSFDNPLLLLGIFDTDAEVRLSKALAQRLATLAVQMQLASDPSVPPEQLAYMAEAQSGLVLTMLVGQGVLVDNGDGYASALKLTNGAVTLNGNPLPFGLQ